MSIPSATRLPNTSSVNIEAYIAALEKGSHLLARMSISQRKRLLHACIKGVGEQSEKWIEASWEAKHIPTDSGARAEDIMTGPMPTLRYLHLLYCSLCDIEQLGKPQLPGIPYQVNGQWRVPVFPTSQLYDALLFGPMKAETWLQTGADEENLFGNHIELVSGKGNLAPQIAVVLGAGNVSSIPITDALSKLFQDGHAVLLKMNPVNEYLGPIFEDAFASLIDVDLLRIVYGGGEIGSQLVHHEAVDEIHITGSDKTHDTIVWGQNSEERQRLQSRNAPLLSKRITSELGNVSPWIIVPGEYSKRQLYFQAENIVSSITHNASFNCIATKMLVTWRQWPEREMFLNKIDSILSEIEPRYPYYPGATERFERFTGQAVKDNRSQFLPWTLLRDVDPEIQPHLFQEESFVCVCAETVINADTEDEFLSRATELVNDQMWGTLSAAITVPSEFHNRRAECLFQLLEELHYGVIGVNQWPGVAFALMSPPWGGFPGTTLQNVQSGIGFVHNTYLLDQVEKTVLSSPLTFWPKPMWFSTHRCPEEVAWKLLKLYKKPSLRRLPPVLLNALRG
ncbi:MAG: aldehyde dehydrogenase family protein [Pirellulales bacterium]